jgi:hypothetical protein
MRITARRIGGGVPLRQAMNQVTWCDADGREHVGLGLQALAARINETAKPPLSFQLIGFLATNGASARETTTPRTADLIEDALSVPRGSLFERVEIRELSDPVPA